MWLNRLGNNFEVSSSDYTQTTQATQHHSTEVIACDILNYLASSMNTLCAAVEVFDPNNAVTQTTHHQPIWPNIVAG